MPFFRWLILFHVAWLWLVILDCCTVLFCSDTCRWFDEHLMDLISLESESTNIHRKHEDAIDTYTSTAKRLHFDVEFLDKFNVDSPAISTPSASRKYSALPWILTKWHIFITCIRLDANFELMISQFAHDRFEIMHRIDTCTYMRISLAEERTRSNAANRNKGKSRGATVDKEYPPFSQTALTMSQQKAPALVIKYW
jgi:hypothetical protein